MKIIKTKIALSLSCALYASTLMAAEELINKEPKSFNDAFKMAEVKGRIKAFYQSNSKLDGAATADTMLGGALGITTAPLNGVSVGATFYTSHALINKKDFKDGDYYNSNGKDYTILGEAFAQYKTKGFELKAGRMELDLPLANSDDSRMIPNLFTAALAQYSPVEKLNLTAGVITQIAGRENGGDHSSFIKMGEIIKTATAGDTVWDTFFANNSAALGSKLYLAGATYEGDVFNLQAWYGRQTEIMDTYYVEGSVKPYDSEAFSVHLAAQYMNESSIGKLRSYASQAGNEAAKIHGAIYGAKIELESKKLGLNGSFAYNKSALKEGVHSNGGTADFFGGVKDPLFTAMDVEGANGEGNVRAYKGEVGFDFAKFGVDGLSVGVAEAYFDKKASASFSRETELNLAYVYKHMSFEAVFSNVKLKDAEDNNRLRVLVKYDF